MRRSFATAVAAIGLAGSVYAFRAQTAASGCDPDNAGLTLPKGFCAGVFARVPSPRHISVALNGDVFVISNPGGGRARGTAPSRGVFRIRDVNHDGKADSAETVLVAGGMGSGVWVTKDALYAEDQGTRPSIPADAKPDAPVRIPPWTTMIVRYPFKPGTTDLTGTTDTIVSGFPTGGHSTRDFVIRGDELYVNVGSNSNACTMGGGRSGTPITQPDPCPELPTRAGVWLYSATKKNQVFDAEHRFVTGLRNGVGISLNPSDNAVYSTQHGRDDLGLLGHHTQEYNAENPGEEFVKLVRGADFGWPYCYFSIEEKKKVTAPEYGGDGKKTDRCEQLSPTIYAFPGHWAPNASLFYTGAQFPSEYRNGVFVAFHGSWNRSPLPPGGDNVTFLPMKNGVATGPHRVFAEGFYGDHSRPAATPGDHRPSGLGQMADGSLLVSDDAGGLVYRIVYTGK